MKRENKRVFLCLLLAFMLVFTTGFRSSASYSRSKAQEVRSVNHRLVILPLASTLSHIPGVTTGIVKEVEKDAAEVAEEKAAKKEEQEARKAAKKAAKKAARKAARKAEREQEQKLLAALIFCEAGNQPFKGQVAVGAVVLNRIKSSKYPDTMRAVIYQKGQFGPAITGWLDRVLREDNIPKQCYKAAKAALKGENPIGDRLYFGCGNYGMKIGDHWFH